MGVTRLMRLKQQPIGCSVEAVATMIGCLPTQALAFSPVSIQTHARNASDCVWMETGLDLAGRQASTGQGVNTKRSLVGSTPGQKLAPLAQKRKSELMSEGLCCLSISRRQGRLGALVPQCGSVMATASWRIYGVITELDWTPM